MYHAYKIIFSIFHPIVSIGWFWYRSGFVLLVSSCRGIHHADCRLYKPTEHLVLREWRLLQKSTGCSISFEGLCNLHWTGVGTMPKLFRRRLCLFKKSNCRNDNCHVRWRIANARIRAQEYVRWGEVSGGNCEYGELGIHFFGDGGTGIVSKTETSHIWRTGANRTRLFNWDIQSSGRRHRTRGVEGILWK